MYVNVNQPKNHRLIPRCILENCVFPSGGSHAAVWSFVSQGTLRVKNRSAKKKVGKNYWSVKILVICTKFSHFVPTKFT